VELHQSAGELLERRMAVHQLRLLMQEDGSRHSELLVVDVVDRRCPRNGGLHREEGFNFSLK